MHLSQFFRLKPYRIRGNFCGMKILLHRKQTGFSRLYFCGSLIPEFSRYSRSIFPAKTIAWCFKYVTECCALKMCILIKIAHAIGLNNPGGMAVAFSLAFMIHSLANTALLEGV